MKQVLIETVDTSLHPLKPSIVTERAMPSFGVSKNDQENQSYEKFLTLDGLFLEGECYNRNQRWYPKSEIVKAVESMNSRIKANGPIAGELDHPEGLNINFANVALAITSMRSEGNNGYGTMKVMNEGMGLIMRGAYEVGIKFGVSSRGSGEVDYNGHVSDYDIVTVDAVINPSAWNAYPAMSLGESIASNKNGREAIRLSHEVTHDPDAERHLVEALKRCFIEQREQYSWRAK